MLLNLLKTHGSGNDFFIIDELTTNLSFTEEERRNLAIALCDRTGELGADGILYVLKSDHANADARMRVFNADGSEASMCGNGLRCVARYAIDVLGKENMVIETMKIDLQVEKTDDIYEGMPTFKVEISPVSFQVNDLPLVINQAELHNERLPELDDTLLFSALAVPNPHLVTITETEVIQSDVQEVLATKVNGPNELFPDGVNVSFVKELAPGNIYVRTFERGVGFTNACGTAMSASSLVTCLNGLNELETDIFVYNNGGKVKCIVHHDQETNEYSIDLVGNATNEYQVQIDVDVQQSQQYTILSKESFTQEIDLYSKLKAEVQEYLNKTL